MWQGNSHPRVLRRLENIVVARCYRKSQPLQLLIFIGRIAQNSYQLFMALLTRHFDQDRRERSFFFFWGRMWQGNSHPRVLRRLENIVVARCYRKSQPLQLLIFIGRIAQNSYQLFMALLTRHFDQDRQERSFFFFWGSNVAKGLSPEGSPTARKYSRPSSPPQVSVSFSSCYFRRNAS